MSSTRRTTKEGESSSDSPRSSSSETSSSGPQKEGQRELKPYEKILWSYVDKDINAVRNEYFFESPKIVQKLFLNPKAQKRDLPLFHCLYNFALANLLNVLLIPWLIHKPWYYAAVISFTRIILFLTRYTLGLHFSSHVPIMKNRALNTFILEWLLCPFMGFPPGAYSNHHVIMHHREDNIHPLDLSSTMPYQRDSFIHFCFYFFRFEFAIWFELPYYLYLKGFTSRFMQTMLGMTLWWVNLYFVWNYTHPKIGLWLFVIPQIFISFLLMLGNWSQHMFIDSKDPTNDHKLTLNLIHTPYNQLTYNDGYHIMHHKYAALHWSLIPSRFKTMKELNEHAKNNSLCLREIDYFVMSVCVFSGNWEYIANRMLPINDSQAAMNTDERIKWMKSLLKPIKATQDDLAFTDPLFGLFKYFFDP